MQEVSQRLVSERKRRCGLHAVPTRLQLPQLPRQEAVLREEQWQEHEKARLFRRLNKNEKVNELQHHLILATGIYWLFLPKQNKNTNELISYSKLYLLF